MPEMQTVSCYRGEPLQLNFTMVPATDITGWTLRFTMATAKNAPTKLYDVAPAVVDAALGTFGVLLASTTTDRRPATYWWDVWRTDAGSERLVAIGALAIGADVRLPDA